MSLSLRSSAILSIVVGILLAIIETLINIQEPQWWALWVVDFIAAGMLIVGGVITLKSHGNSTMLLSSAWSFTAALAWMAAAWLTEHGVEPNNMFNLYLGLTLLLFFLSVIGWFLTALARTK